MARLALEHVGKTYPGGTQALVDCSLELADGELVVLVGPSGCGKSTILRIVAGLEEASTGVVRIGDRVVTDLPAQERNVAMVFQDYALYPHMTTRENLDFPLRMRRLDRDDRTARVGRVAESLGLPAWGFSSSATMAPGGYGEHGVPDLGTIGYSPGVVTPHAAALALAVDPAAAVADLREIARRYPAYGDFGFYDAVDPATGAVAPVYLTLDQAMTFLAVANRLCDGCVQQHFAADPIATRALAVVGDERFFE